MITEGDIDKEKVLVYWDSIVNLMDDDKRESCHLNGDYEKGDDISFFNRLCQSL